MLEILEEVSNKIGEQYESAWLIDGQRMLSPLDLPIQARILVVSRGEEFCGIRNLEKFEGVPTQSLRENVGGATYVNQVQAPSVRVKPQPQTWLHMAGVNWTRKNPTANVPSYSDGGPNDSETQTKIIESIQEEQNRVYKQDQQLLSCLTNPIAEVPGEHGGRGQEDSIADHDAGATPGAAPYDYKELEDDIIKYICEKIIAMREQPFIDAVDNLKRAQELNNLQMIMDIQKNKAKYGQSDIGG